MKKSIIPTPKNLDLTSALIDCWTTTNQTSIYLVKNIPPDLWIKKIPGYKNKSIAMLATHLHNSRCMWIRSIIGKPNTSLQTLRSHRITKKEVLTAMKESSRAMSDLLQSCIENGGRLPSRPAWLNFPNDVIHLLAYFVAHEAHHRGQIIMASRQMGKPFTRASAGELWQWTKKERVKREVKS